MVIATAGRLAIAVAPALGYESLAMGASRLRLYVFALCGFLLAHEPRPASAQAKASASSSSRPHAAKKRDGQRDFDFEIGTWRTRLKRRLHPLTGSSTWVEYTGTSVVRKIWGGRANLIELDVTGPAGRIEGLSLRLYNPETRQWSLNYANSRSGTMTEPVFGEFVDGRGEFFGVESLNGRIVLVRFIISEITPTSCHFEQSFSDDGGKTWEVNWIADDTRVKGKSDKST